MEIIASRQNPTVKAIRELKKRAARDTLGLAFIEGERIVKEALAAAEKRPSAKTAPGPGGTDIKIEGGCPAGKIGVYLQSLCVSESYARGAGFEVISRESAAKNIRLIILADRVFEAISDTMNPQGLLAVIEYFNHDLSDLYSRSRGPSRLLLLDRVSDPGNAGVMMRTAEAAAFSGVVMSEGCVDIYEPKTLRATMGAVFRIPFICRADLADTVGVLREKGFCIYASAAVSPTASPAPALSATAASVAPAVSAPAAGSGENFLDCFDSNLNGGDIALIIGSEAHGVSARLLTLCDAILSVPMSGGAESLNAGVAAGILMYEFMRRDRLGGRCVSN